MTTAPANTRPPRGARKRETGLDRLLAAAAEATDERSLHLLRVTATGIEAQMLVLESGSDYPVEYVTPTPQALAGLLEAVSPRAWMRGIVVVSLLVDSIAGCASLAVMEEDPFAHPDGGLDERAIARWVASRYRQTMMPLRVSGAKKERTR